MGKSNRRSYSEWNVEEFVNLIRQKKRWKPANTPEELNERIEKGKMCMIGGKNTKETIDVFIKYPELFLYITEVANLKRKYRGAFTFNYGANSTQIGKYETVVDKLHKAANVLYENVLDILKQEEIAKEAPKQKSEPELDLREELARKGKTLADIFDDDLYLDGPKEGKGGKKLNRYYARITKVVREKFENDDTPLLRLANVSDKIGQQLVAIGVKTVGDFVSMPPNIKGNLQSMACHEKDKSYNALVKAVMDHINATIAKENGETYVIETKNTESEEVSLEGKTLSEEKTNEPEIYEKVRSYPAEKFVKDSEELKEIFDIDIVPYITAVAKKYVAQNASAEKIAELVKLEYGKFYKIIDEKREELKTEQQQAETWKVVSKVIEDGSHYHHDKNAFTQTDLERGAHKHFRNGNPRSLDGKDF